MINITVRCVATGVDSVEFVTEERQPAVLRLSGVTYASAFAPGQRYTLRVDAIPTPIPCPLGEPAEGEQHQHQQEPEEQRRKMMGEMAKDVATFNKIVKGEPAEGDAK